MSKKWFVCAVAAMVASSAFANQMGSGDVTPNLDRGTKVLEGAGYANLMADELNFQLSYGMLLADGFEVGVVAGLRDSENYMSTELGVRAEYNFVFGSAFVPFVGVGLSWASVEADPNDIDTDAAVFSASAGMKYFIRNDVALAVSGRYLLATDDIFVDSDDGKAADDEFQILFGIRFYFD